MFSEFDTAIVNFNAALPYFQKFKFLPEVGGAIITACSIRLDDSSGDGRGANDHPGVALHCTVDYTTPRKVKGIWGKGKVDWRIPTSKLWKRLPWNNDRPPSFRLFVRYSDDDFRILQDLSGDFLVYTKPVIPRPLDLVRDAGAETKDSEVK